MTDLTLLGIAEAGHLLARGEITATALTDSFLKRIEAVDHKIAAYHRDRHLKTRPARPTWAEGRLRRGPTWHPGGARGHL
jgi:Asp-tRNA(Asn)/Glu-tRNA(Gln) amidotransferase A subunit family amidase